MFDPDQLSVEIVQILDENGNGDERQLAAFSDEWLLRAYREMRRARVIDERLLRMQRQGGSGPTPRSAAKRRRKSAAPLRFIKTIGFSRATAKWRYA
ncbi:hypothetical protein LR69_01455 [Geobacillus sp. BCO2]|nr:hypothetical protein LR69_01455 [Geobacillus sp. BCO2]